MKKEVSPSIEMAACEVCGRTILKGERTEPYVVPDGSRRLVCELCTRRAEGAGWLRESTHAGLPATSPSAEPRRSLLTRLRRRRGGDNGPAAPAEHEPVGTPTWDDGFYDPEPALDQPVADDQVAPAGGSETPAGDLEADPDDPSDEQAASAHEPDSDYNAPPPAVDESVTAYAVPPAADPGGEGFVEDARERRRERRSRRRLRDPRHVRAVPTRDDVKVVRALELFNASEFQRTTAGLMRTLGEPWVTARPHLESASEVTIVIAWELSWYQYRVDLSDTHEAVALVDKGQELDELDAALREWNAGATSEGVLQPATPA